MKCQHKINRAFVYTTASESSKPGYLQRKFILIRKQQAEEQARIEAENGQNVRQLKRERK